jgi:hypothetical protein
MAVAQRQVDKILASKLVCHSVVNLTITASFDEQKVAPQSSSCELQKETYFGVCSGKLFQGPGHQSGCEMLILNTHITATLMS